MPPDTHPLFRNLPDLYRSQIRPHRYHASRTWPLALQRYTRPQFHSPPGQYRIRNPHHHKSRATHILPHSEHRDIHLRYHNPADQDRILNRPRMCLSMKSLAHLNTNLTR